MDRFIVGTGRCGSTLLSRMLAKSPQVTSLFEFFGGLDLGRRFATEPMSGEEFADLISSEQPVVTAFLRRGYRPAEIVYPFSPRSRFKPEEPLPWILVGVLPRLSDDPDSLFDEVMSFAAQLPRQHLRDHYRALFDWLTARTGGEVWIERSGCSIELLGPLHEFFPEARFLHLHRDGPEAALSMREHPAFRLAVPLIYSIPLLAERGSDLQELRLDTPPEPTDPIAQAANLAEIDFSAPPTPDDPLSRLLASRPPVEYFGRYWTDQIIHGLRAVKYLDRDQYLEVRFEDLISRPAETLRVVSEFFDLDPDREGWIERAAAMIRGAPPLRFPELPNEDQERLARACWAGRQLLDRGS